MTTLGEYLMVMNDNGGTTAIRGFNYQKASIMLVLLKNFKKECFAVAPERGDDFEVHLGNEIIYVQVKGTKQLSLNNLMTRKKGESNSILDKSLAVGKKNDLRKIFLWDFKLTDRDGMEISEDGKLNLPQTLYKFSDSQKDKIKKKLNLDEDGNKRLDKQHIYITPFINNHEVAIDFLIGVAIREGFSGEANQVRLFLGELGTVIDQKSEKKVESDIAEKLITDEYVTTLFNSFKNDTDFKEVLDSLDLTIMQKKAISFSKLKINQLYSATKNEVLLKLSLENLMTQSENEAINEIVEMIQEVDKKIEKNIAIAIAIECYCEIGDRQYDN